MLDWDKLRIFFSVAQAGSFTRAGETLSLSQSAISRQISALEESLNSPLFHRHARGLVLTEQGDILLKAVHEIYSRLAAAENCIQDSRDRPRGELKVTAAVTLGSTWLTPHLDSFLKIYPDIQISVLLDDRELDLSIREADVALRFTKPQHSDMVSKHLTVFKNSVYASRKYIENCGKPISAAELSDHRIIVFGEDYRPPFADINWLMNICKSRRDTKTCDYFKINGLLAMLKAVEGGIGIAALPEYMAKYSPHLVHIMPELEGPKTDLFFVYPSELRNSKRVNVFKDFIARQISEFSNGN